MKIVLNIILATLLLFISTPSSYVVYGINPEQKKLLKSGISYLDIDEDSQCSTSSGATGVSHMNGGNLFLIGDSISDGIKTSLPAKLGSTWSVSSDTEVGRQLSTGVSIVNSSPPPIGLAQSNAVLVVLGTNNLLSGNNEQLVSDMVEGIKSTAPESRIFWLEINVTRSDIAPGMEPFNEILKSNSNITTLSNNVALGDGVHPSSSDDLAKSIADQLSGGGGQAMSVTMGGCQCSSSLVGLSGSDNAERVWNYFTGKGLGSIHVAGIMGNISIESGFDPEIVQGGGRSQNPESITGSIGGGNAYGLLQWDPGSRIPPLLEQAGIPGKAHELGTQLELVWWHMHNQSPTGRNNFIESYLKTNTIEEATASFERGMEGAGKPAMEKRIREARVYHDMYGDGSTSSVTGSIPSSGSCSDVTGPGRDTKFIDGFTVYSQYDPQWKDLPYSSSTIGVSGCGPSAMAMVITNLKGEQVTPVDTAKVAGDRGMYIPGQGSSWDISKVLADEWGLNAVHIGLDAGKITETLQAGGLVVTAGLGAKPFTGGGHFIVIRAVTAEGKWKVGDSGHSDTSDKEWEPNDLLASMADRGGSVYAITK